VETANSFIQTFYAEQFGVLPTSSVIKPVHVANGLARSLTGRSYRSVALARSLRRWIRDQKTGLDDERNPTSEIIRDFGAAFGARKQDGDLPVDALNDLRTLLRDVFAADGAVFGDPDKSSYTLSNERFSTNDPSDRRVGEFVARVLLVGPPPHEAAERLRHLLATETDAWTTLALPLLALTETPREAPLAKSQTEDPLLRCDEQGRLVSPVLRTLRECLDRLARFDQAEGSKLNALRRLVLFACFAVHVHLIARWAESDSAAPRPPILIDLFDGARASLRDASRATLRSGGAAIEALVVASVVQHLQNAFPEPQAALDGLTAQSRLAVEKRLSVYLQGETSAHQAVAQSLFDIGCEEIGAHPANFLSELGRRAGYLTPWANEGRGGRLQKRYGITAEFLEILVGATVDPGEPLDFDEFLDRLRENLGIVAGRPDDSAAIRANNLRGRAFGTPVAFSEEDLRQNVAALRRLVVESGYAKSYADGRTMITTTPEAFR
jgi:hypothetical protein